MSRDYYKTTISTQLTQAYEKIALALDLSLNLHSKRGDKVDYMRSAFEEYYADECNTEESLWLNDIRKELLRISTVYSTLIVNYPSDPKLTLDYDCNLTAIACQLDTVIGILDSAIEKDTGHYMIDVLVFALQQVTGA